MEKEKIAVEFSPEQTEYLNSVVAREVAEGNSITVSDLLALYAKSVGVAEMLITAIHDADLAASA